MITPGSQDTSSQQTLMAPAALTTGAISQGGQPAIILTQPVPSQNGQVSAITPVVSQFPVAQTAILVPARLPYQFNYSSPPVAFAAPPQVATTQQPYAQPIMGIATHPVRQVTQFKMPYQVAPGQALAVSSNSSPGQVGQTINDQTARVPQVQQQQHPPLGQQTQTGALSKQLPSPVQEGKATNVSQRHFDIAALPPINVNMVGRASFKREQKQHMKMDLKISKLIDDKVGQKQELLGLPSSKLVRKARTPKSSNKRARNGKKTTFFDCLMDEFPCSGSPKSAQGPKANSSLFDVLDNQSDSDSSISGHSQGSNGAPDCIKADKLDPKNGNDLDAQDDLSTTNNTMKAFDLMNYTSRDVNSLTLITGEMNRRMSQQRGLKRGRKIQTFTKYCQNTTKRINLLKSQLCDPASSENKKKQLRNQISAFQARLKQRIKDMDQQLRLEQKHQQLAGILSVVAEIVDLDQKTRIHEKIDLEFPEMNFYSSVPYLQSLPQETVKANKGKSKKQKKNKAK